VKALNAQIEYMSDDGFFHAKTTGLTATTYTFEKNTHTGTETLLLAAVLAEGTTILKNAAEEPEIDDLIELLNRMGGNIVRSDKREITIVGVEKLHGAEFEITPDRNEIVTFAVAAYVTKGDIFIEDAQKVNLDSFLEKLDEAGGTYEIKENGIRFYYSSPLKAVDVTTSIYPGFMTDWQSIWAILMTQAEGKSIVHETVFENKLGYVTDLQKMGAKMRLFNPEVVNPEEVYNFNLEDDQDFYHAVEISGPARLHNAIVSMIDLRAGAAVVIAALSAKGETIIHNIYLTDRGYENLEDRIRSLGGDITRVKE
jgi:UDP-N-acetylglucosamine 1-carboxyvinyltransferase